MGILVDKKSVRDGFTTDEELKKYFPEYQSSNADKFIKLSTESCANQSEVIQYTLKLTHKDTYIQIKKKGGAK